MNFPEELKYTKDHEWVKIEGNIAIVGISDFAQNELGDIVYVEFDTLDSELLEGDVMGSIEAVKTVSDVFVPIQGRIIEVNEQLEYSPELVNSDPYENGWLVKIEILKNDQLNELLDVNEYKKLIGIAL